MGATVMSWSKCVIKIAPTGANDALGSSLTDVGVIKDKSTTIETAEGEKRTMKATGGVTIAQEMTDGEITLKTRIIEPDYKTIAALFGKSVRVQTAALVGATTIKIDKNPKAYVGMYLGNGTQKAIITAIDTTNGAYDTLTITLGVALAIGDVLYETDVNGNLLFKTNVVADQWSVEITPKNIGATGVRVRKTALTYKEGYSEDDGQYADLTFTIIACNDGELYTKFKKTA